MKIFNLLLMLLPGFAWAEHSAVHGMLVLGTEKIYLSHLPMFHAPHDSQVIFEAEFDAATMAQLKASKEASRETVYTLVPEPFALGEMVAKPHSFGAELYRGHFERGGTLIAENVKVSAPKVLFRQKLKPETLPAKAFSGFFFGSGGKGWLAHVIHGKPDFDQFVEVDSAGVNLVVTFSAPNEPLEEGQVLRSVHGTLKIKKSVYLEFDDLGH
ncbi:MAG: hypothetical protein AB7K68_02435 [Bacteriovoracia bacterium]